MPRTISHPFSFRHSSFASLCSPRWGRLRLAVSLRSAVIRISLLLGILLVAAGAPAQDTSTHDILIDGEEWQEAVTGQTFTDGLASDPEGNLYFTDLSGGVYEIVGKRR